MRMKNKKNTSSDFGHQKPELFPAFIAQQNCLHVVYQPDFAVRVSIGAKTTLDIPFNLWVFPKALNDQLGAGSKHPQVTEMF